jgi:chitinase
MVNTLDASANSLFHSKVITGLSDGNTYTYYVRCQDVFLNANATDSTISFAVSAVVGDVTAPSQVVGVQGTALNANQISLTWDAATDNIGVTGYEVYVSEAGVDYTLASAPTTASAIVSSLSPSALYLIKVRARDAVGNFGAMSDPIVVLTPPSDVTPPSDLTGLAVTPVDFQSLDLVWTAGTDNLGDPRTSIEMCQGATCTLFALASTVNAGTNTLRVSGLHPLTTYRFRGKHVDAAGNVSVDYSAPVSGTTPAVPSATVTAICPCKHHR